MSICRSVFSHVQLKRPDAAVQIQETIRILFHGIVCTGFVDFNLLMVPCMHLLADSGALEFNCSFGSCCVVLYLLPCTIWMHVHQLMHSQMPHRMSRSSAV